jgi:hypothetical protein
MGWVNGRMMKGDGVQRGWLMVIEKSYKVKLGDHSVPNMSLSCCCRCCFQLCSWVPEAHSAGSNVSKILQGNFNPLFTHKHSKQSYHAACVVPYMHARITAAPCRCAIAGVHACMHAHVGSFRLTHLYQSQRDDKSVRSRPFPLRDTSERVYGESSAFFVLAVEMESLLPPRLYEGELGMYTVERQIYILVCDGVARVRSSGQVPECR